MVESESLEAKIRSWADNRGANVSIETYRREIQEYINMSESFNLKTTLEVGAGMGFFSAVLVEDNVTEKAIALDPVVEGEGTSKSLYKKNRKYIEERYNGRVRFEDGFFPDDIVGHNVDMIVFRKVLHHIYEKRSSTNKEVLEGLKAAKDCLGENGRVYIRESNAPILPARKAYDVKRYINGVGSMDWDEKRSCEEWVEVLKKSGFEDVRYRRLPYNIVVDNQWLEHLSSKISGRFLITGTYK
jgi:hypothetical protein